MVSVLILLSLDSRTTTFPSAPSIFPLISTPLFLSQPVIMTRANINKEARNILFFIIKHNCYKIQYSI